MILPSNMHNSMEQELDCLSWAASSVVIGKLFFPVPHHTMSCIPCAVSDSCCTVICTYIKGQIIIHTNIVTSAVAIISS